MACCNGSNGTIRYKGAAPLLPQSHIIQRWSLEWIQPFPICSSNNMFLLVEFLDFKTCNPPEKLQTDFEQHFKCWMYYRDLKFHVRDDNIWRILNSLCMNSKNSSEKIDSSQFDTYGHYLQVIVKMYLHNW